MFKNEHLTSQTTINLLSTHCTPRLSSINTSKATHERRCTWSTSPGSGRTRWRHAIGGTPTPDRGRRPVSCSPSRNFSRWRRRREASTVPPSAAGTAAEPKLNIWLMLWLLLPSSTEVLRRAVARKGIDLKYRSVCNLLFNLTLAFSRILLLETNCTFQLWISLKRWQIGQT